MTVKEYIENRPFKLYGKKIRVLSAGTHKNMGDWLKYANATIKEVKITSKIIFIFI